MIGKIIVATGATSGLGAVAVERLAELGARVVFIARDRARAEAKLAALERIGPGRGHAYHLADLSLIKDTKRVGAEIAEREPRVDVLINNAGAIFRDRRVSGEGIEMTFALNHMAYFTLTRTLEERLKASAPSRVVSTASRAHLSAKLDFDDLQNERCYWAWTAYGRSKLANILFTRALASRLAGAGVVANCFHPGFVASRFGDEAGGWIGLIAPLAKKLGGLTPEAGADTLVWLASAPQAGEVSGEYFCKRKPTFRTFRARDDTSAAGLWAASEALYAAH